MNSESEVEMASVSIQPISLEKAMMKKGWNRQQLADNSGVSFGTISAIYAGKPCRTSTAIKIVDSLGIELEAVATIKRV